MTTRSQKIVEQLREAIIAGDYDGGARMNEVELAEALKVSRTPVRSALSTLATEGLLHYTPNSGFVVRKFAAKDVENVIDVNSTLAGLAARLAAARGLGEERLGHLHVVLAKSKKLLEHREWTSEVSKAWESYDAQYHAAIVEATDNAHLVSAIRRTSDIPVLKDMRFRYIDPDELLLNYHAHVQILDAIDQGNQLRAESLMREHVFQNGQRVLRQWRQLEAVRDRSASPPDANADAGLNTTNDEIIS